MVGVEFTQSSSAAAAAASEPMRVGYGVYIRVDADLALELWCIERKDSVVV